ncbi:MAG TPA: response regulator [Thermoanaerobaculia bacterium]|nr:response regulator [Thermoanaerobaculia bacterium]
MTIRAVIVDDEPLAREVIREHLTAHEEFELVAECANGFEAVKAVADHQPDLLFLDIQMPKLDGFEVLELLEHKPVVVFVTAYDEYAIKAFEVHAVDYLLKPFREERFAAVLDHVLDLLRRRQTQPLEKLQSAAGRFPLQRILVRDGAQIEVLPVARLDYVEAQDDYVCFVAGEKKLRKQQRLADLERALDPGRFVRIHRSYILNVDRLDRVELYAKDSRVAILKDGTRLPVSRSGYDRLRQLL